jgi:hypothetical protein
MGSMLSSKKGVRSCLAVSRCCFAAYFAFAASVALPVAIHKVAFQSCILLVSILFGRGYSAKTRRNHDTLHHGADLPALHRARPSNSQQAHDSAHRLTLKSPHDRLVCCKSYHQRIGTATIGTLIKLSLCTDRTSRKWQPSK